MTDQHLLACLRMQSPATALATKNLLHPSSARCLTNVKNECTFMK